MAANLITVNSWTKLNYQNSPNTTAEAIIINPAKILSVQTRATALNTTGITDILYEFPVNQMTYQLTLTVTQAASAIVTAANASTTPA